VEVDACLLRRGSVVRVKALQELGVYGTFLGNGQQENEVGVEDGVVFNQLAVHLLRTKATGVDEGGVATGFSCLDSPFLV